MYELSFEGVRCFSTLQQIQVKPLTLLVGENSSGKSTFLALNRLAWDLVEGDWEKDWFNEDPFNLGTYNQVASYRGGRGGRAKFFTVGIKNSKNEIQARFTSAQSGIELEQYSFTSNQVTVTIDNPFKENYVIKFTGSIEKEIKVESNLRFLPARYQNKLSQIIGSALIEIGEKPAIFMPKHLFFRRMRVPPLAFAPVRTKPKRTYDPLKEVREPEGSHIPMTLARLFAKGNAHELRQALNNFGQASGLFEAIEIQRKGQQDSDPFQIAIKTKGPAFNLVDVGYGVSQVLPIVVDILQNPPESTFLLQQPEVHLHPRAQAELGSFLAALVKEQKKKFIIETHSDYLVDRVRMDIRDKKFLRPEDVALLFFDKTDKGVEIHQLELDEYGNILNAPPTYRTFFMNEERRLLGI